MQQEVDKLYGLAQIKCNFLYNDKSIDLFIPKTNDIKSLNIELNGYTLTFFYVLNISDPTLHSFLKISIYHIRFNRDGNFIDKDNIPRLFDPADVLIKSDEYSFVKTQSYGSGWTEEPRNIKFSTSKQLVEDWFERFLQEALNSPKSNPNY